MSLSENAKTFLDANRQSPVVEASVIGAGGKGAQYRLLDRRQFTLLPKDLALMPQGFPRWKMYRS